MNKQQKRDLKLLKNNNFRNNQNYTISKNIRNNIINHSINTKNQTSSWISQYYDGYYGRYLTYLLKGNSSNTKIFFLIFLGAFCMPFIYQLYSLYISLFTGDVKNFDYTVFFINFTIGITPLFIIGIAKYAINLGNKHTEVMYDNKEIIIYNKNYFN